MLKRNAKNIIAQLTETKSNELFTKKACVIQFPKRYTESNLAEISRDTYLFGVYALIMDGEYAVSAIPAYFHTSPERVSESEVDGVPYINFHYSPGCRVLDNTNVLRKDSLIYSLIYEFFLQGNVPWYVGYEDLAKVFDVAKEFADSNVAQNYAITEAMTAYIARIASDRAVQYRLDPKGSPAYIGLKGNVFYAAPGTVNKLAGSYFQDAIVSALVQPSSKTSHVEDLLRT